MTGACTVKCSNCGSVLDETPAEAAGGPRTPCPACGSEKRTVCVSLVDAVEVHDSVKYKGKRPGVKKALFEGRAGDDLTRTTGKWADRSVLVDRENNKYVERVVEKETGKVLHECEEPLDQHTGHGSAKKRPPKR